MEPEVSLPNLQQPAIRPYSEPVQSNLRHSNRSFKIHFILYSRLCLGLPNGLFRSCLPTKTLYAPLVSPIRATCPNPVILCFITATVFGKEYRLWSFSIRNLSSLFCYSVPRRSNLEEAMDFSQGSVCSESLLRGRWLLYGLSNDCATKSDYMTPNGRMGSEQFGNVRRVETVWRGRVTVVTNGTS